VGVSWDFAIALGGVMSKFGDTLHGGPVTADDVIRVRDILLFDGPERRARLIRFAALLVLASAIATFGLIGDSVATVIGAMIVAPLMLPIMGLAFGISIGDRKAIVSSLLVALGGIAAAIVVGYILSLPFVALNPETNTQIASRTAPRLVDLFAALATGLAGAFATSRKDVSDTLPGVAIAISLVPPLANVGILLGAGRPDMAIGSMLLFVTNYFAILLTGSLMFGLMGFPRVVFAGQSHRARRAATTIVLVLAMLIVVPLGATSYSVSTSSVAESRSADAAASWLEGSDYRVVSTTAGDDVRVVVAGSGTLPDVAQFEQSVAGRLFDKPVVLEVVPERLVEFESR